MYVFSSRLNDGLIGYPMSDYVARLGEHKQSYAARELACHFSDHYHQRLKGEYLVKNIQQ